MNPRQKQIYNQIRRHISGLGYQQDHLFKDYKFVDPLGAGLVQREIPMAAFAQLPPDYSNACIGVIFANGQSGSQNVAEYRTLGAPMILEIYKDRVVRYQINHLIKPIRIESIRPNELANVFEHNKGDWGPARILQAKSQRRQQAAVQLDFVDAGLMPALEGVVQQKLHKLLKELLEHTSEEYQERHKNAAPLPELFRLVFRLLAAKVMHDRDQGSKWEVTDVADALQNIRNYTGTRCGSRST